MAKIRFTWDPKKAARNKRRKGPGTHGVSFETAIEAFEDPNVIILEDREDENGELRFHAIGLTAAALLLLVVFVERASNDEVVIRVISARKADDYEQILYSTQFEKA